MWSAAATGARSPTPPSPGTDPALDLLAATAAGTATSAPGAEPPPVRADPGWSRRAAALRLVSAAVLDGATVTRYESTIAGERSTCVGVHGAAGFTACVTAEGLLGSFTGTVDGGVVSFELTSYAAERRRRDVRPARPAPRSTTAAPDRDLDRSRV